MKTVFAVPVFLAFCVTASAEEPTRIADLIAQGYEIKAASTSEVFLQKDKTGYVCALVRQSPTGVIPIDVVANKGPCAPIK